MTPAARAAGFFVRAGLKGVRRGNSHTQPSLHNVGAFGTGIRGFRSRPQPPTVQTTHPQWVGGGDDRVRRHLRSLPRIIDLQLKWCVNGGSIRRRAGRTGWWAMYASKATMIPKSLPIRASLLDRDATATLKVFTIVFLILVGLFVVGIFLLNAMDQRVEAARDRVGAAFAVKEAVRQADFFVEAAAGDVRIVSQDPAVLALASGDASAMAEVAADFQTFLSEKPTITQLRFLDDTGMEMVRVERRNGAIVTVGEADLQDKSARYYFNNAMTLSPNGIYLSALDLNLERGEVEVPWRPVLRLAVPVARPDGATAGLVVMNLDARAFIASIEGVRFAGNRSVVLLNDAGYWLTGGTLEKRWGFVFGTDETLARTDPGLWERVLDTGAGDFAYGGADYSVAPVRPADILARGRAGIDVAYADERWIVLAEVPKPTPLPVLIGWPRMLLILFMSALISFFTAQSVVARRRADAARQAAQAELVHADRLASLGSLVAGVAHELNTPLGNALAVGTTLSERVGTLKASVEDGRIQRSALDSLLNDILSGTALLVRGVERAAEIVRHFKQVSVDQTIDRRRTFEMATFVQDIAGSLEPQFRGTTLDLRTDIRSKAVLDGYPGTLAQVVTNLVANARIHGFDPGDRGQVTIGCRDLPGDEVEITVRDTGRGMAPDVLGHIYDPFFTTRLGSGGSGMGLAIVYNIVKGTLAGQISISSTPGAGTVVVLRLPVLTPVGGPNLRRSEYNVTAR